MRRSSAGTTRAIATRRSRSSRSAGWPLRLHARTTTSSTPPPATPSSLALEIEIAAQRAYTGLISRIRTDDYLLSAAFILVDEVRHMTVWQRVLGLRIY